MSQLFGAAYYLGGREYAELFTRLDRDHSGALNWDETLIEQVRKRGMTLEWKPQKGQ